MKDNTQARETRDRLDPREERAFAHAEKVHAMCWKGERPHLGIPARPDEDTDLVALRVAQDVQGLLGEVSRLRERVKELEAERDEARENLSRAVSPPDEHGVRMICLGYHPETDEYEWLAVMPTVPSVEGSPDP